MTATAKRQHRWDEPPESPFVPLAEPSRYRPPHATIDPDASKSWLGRMMPIVRTHKLMLGTSLVATFLALVAQVQIPQALGDAIDKGLAPGSRSLGHYVQLIALLALFRWLLNLVGRYFLQTTAYRYEYDLRHIMYEHLSRLSFSFYDRVQSGQLISRANSDIRSVQMYLAYAPSIITQCAIAVMAFVLMLTINVPLAIVAMVTMPIVAIIGVKMRERLFPMSWLIQSRLAEVATVVDENINGVRVVKSFAAEERQLKLLAQASRRTEWANAQDAAIRARWSPAIEQMPRVGQALVLFYGGWMALHGHATVGTIVAFNAYVLLLQPPFRMIGQLLMMGQRAKASAGRIFEVLDEQPEIVDRAGAVDLVECHGDVHFEVVDFDYPNGTPVLRGFELRLRPGETVALVGRTGSGKSTVARLLNRSYEVTGGRIVVDGHDIRDYTLASLRHHVGTVADEPFLFSISIRDNLVYGRPDATDEEVLAAAKAAAAHDFITALPEGYDTVIGERGYTLSGGQRQRLSIARTLVVNPPILILDDATSAIDVQVEQQIHGALDTLLRQRTTLVIAHRLSTISLADRVVVLEDGAVLAEGTHSELLATEPRYVEILAQVEEGEG